MTRIGIGLLHKCPNCGKMVSMWHVPSGLCRDCYSKSLEGNSDNFLTNLRIWCTKCDCNLEYGGMALDSPNDGHYYICPTCKSRIVVFPTSQ